MTHQDTPDTRRLRDNVLDWLDEQGMDAHTRAAEGNRVQGMNYAELVTTYPCLTGE
jgi:hypothetical protein